MELEGAGDLLHAKEIFEKAWNEAESDIEKLTAAHYLARHQESVFEKYKWDQIALQLALKVNDEKLKAILPSLFLNIGKCYEDMGHRDFAKSNYEIALSYIEHMPNDGYAQMIHRGIINGLERVK
jgi:rifampin ADP-ribosylating transferase